MTEPRDRWNRLLSTPIDQVAARVLGESWIGRRFGSYEILAPLGAGGMGEVYRARDIRLERDVAIKVLPASFAEDRERRARFEREARILAALNYPHIATIYGIEDVDGVSVLVLELVDGETLAARIARGPLPIRDAIPIARQIVAALDAAHEKGIVHRDLKPSNIALTKDGTVKVLDFGLAKASDPTASDASRSPTLTVSARDGVLLGTAAYMSPEQARGQAVDKRADIWAFGCVLYEMLTGRVAFAGATTSDHIAAILERDPDWQALPPSTPTAVRNVLRCCLAKDQRHRLRDIADAQLEFDDRTETAATDRSALRPPTTIVASALTLAIGIGAGALLVSLRTPSSPPVPAHLTVELGADASMPTEVGPNVALSADGTTLAFVALTRDSRTTQLYARRLDELNAHPLPGTEDARNPFFSPDGRWVAFFVNGKLKKVSITGGPPITVCDAPDSRGGVWLNESTIVFQPDTGPSALARVNADGGSPEPFVSSPGIKGSMRWPQVLPGGKAVLYTVGSAGQFEVGSIVVQALRDSKPRIVLRNAYYGRFVETGHILYVHQGSLFAVPFNLERLEVTGPSVQVVEGVSGSAGTGGAEFAVSRAGVLMYVPSKSTEDVISWMDRSGSATTLRAAPGIWTNPAFSPDGGRLAMEISDGTQFHVWVYDLDRDTATKLTFGDTGFSRPVWTPDARRIAFALRGEGPLNLYWIRADGGGQPQRLSESPNSQEPDSWHPSGKFLAYTEQRPGTKRDLMVLPVSGNEESGWTPGEPIVFLSTPFEESNPMFSPDGRWIAYNSDETGRSEVFVRPFPGPGPKVQISSGGGGGPRWSPTRHELLFRGADNRIMFVSYQVVGDAFRTGKPQLWSTRPLPAGIMRPTQRQVFTVHPDGDRIALFVPPEPVSGQRDKIVLVLNFFDQLRLLGRSAAP